MQHLCLSPLETLVGCNPSSAEQVPNLPIHSRSLRDRGTFPVDLSNCVHYGVCAIRGEMHEETPRRTHRLHRLLMDGRAFILKL